MTTSFVPPSLAEVVIITSAEVATGTRHDERALAEVALHNVAGKCLFRSYVKPPCTVVNCLTQLSGVHGGFESSAKPMQTVVEELKNAFRELRSQAASHSLVVTSPAGEREVRALLKAMSLAEGQDYDTLYAVEKALAYTEPRFGSTNYMASTHMIQIAEAKGFIRLPPESSFEVVGAVADGLRLGVFLQWLSTAPKEKVLEFQLHALSCQPRPSIAAVNGYTMDGVCVACDGIVCTCKAAKPKPKRTQPQPAAQPAVAVASPSKKSRKGANDPSVPSPSRNRRKNVAQPPPLPAPLPQPHPTVRVGAVPPMMCWVPQQAVGSASATSDALRMTGANLVPVTFPQWCCPVVSPPVAVYTPLPAYSAAPQPPPHLAAAIPSLLEEDSVVQAGPKISNDIFWERVAAPQFRPSLTWEE